MNETPTQGDITPVALIYDVRERLVRIETKMDSSVEKVERHETKLEEHDERLTAIETAQREQKAQIAIFRWIGAAVIALITLVTAILSVLK